jgi:GAF domain-containing protein
VFVPIFVGDRLTASITLESFEREDAYGDAEVHLLSAVAASMGLALRNAQLFNETKTALEQQTATGEVLQAISNSVADTAPVFDTIVRNAVLLCDGLFANVLLFDGELLHFAATGNSDPAFMKLVHGRSPMRPDATQIAEE